MKVDKEALKGALEQVSHAIKSGDKIPILSCVHLSVSRGVLILRGTDLDIEIDANVKVKGDMGQTCVAAALLLNVVKLHAGELDVTNDGKTLVVKSGRRRHQLPTLSPEGFPSLAPQDWQVTAKVEGSEICELLAQVSPAISKDESRYYLRGVAFMPGQIFDANAGGHMTLVATNGHTLAVRDMEIAELDGTAGTAILPAKAVQAAIRIFSAGGDLQLRLNDARFEIEGRVRLTSKLVEGTYPDWRRASPLDLEPGISLKSDALRDAVEAVAVVTSGKAARAVKLTLGEQLSVSAENRADGGSATDECEVEIHDAALWPETVGLNADYVREVLANLGSETAALSSRDTGSPVLITAPGDPSRVSVIMPMRV